MSAVLLSEVLVADFDLADVSGLGLLWRGGERVRKHEHGSISVCCPILDAHACDGMVSVAIIFVLIIFSEWQQTR